MCTDTDIREFLVAALFYGGLLQRILWGVLLALATPVQVYAIRSLPLR